MRRTSSGIAALAAACFIAGGTALAQRESADPLAVDRQMLAEDNPGELWIDRGKQLFHEKRGKRIGDMALKGKAIDPNRRYKVASWAPVGEGASGEPVWDVVMTYLRDRKVIRPSAPNRPRLIGTAENGGVADRM